MGLTPQQVIDLVVALENDLAVFYTHLPLEGDLKPLKKICRFMAQHSEIHARMIANYRDDAAVPQLNVDPLAALHERLKTSLREELGTQTDLAEAARKLSQAEEIIGLAYSRIADHLASVSAAYEKIAGKFHSLAEDERNHRDYILREQARIGAPSSASPPADDP